MFMLPFVDVSHSLFLCFFIYLHYLRYLNHVLVCSGESCDIAMSAYSFNS